LKWPRQTRLCGQFNTFIHHIFHTESCIQPSDRTVFKLFKDAYNNACHCQQLRSTFRAAAPQADWALHWKTMASCPGRRTAGQASQCRRSTTQASYSRSSADCPRCSDGAVNLWRDNSAPDGQIWHCSNRRCRYKITVRKHSFFAGSHCHSQLSAN